MDADSSGEKVVIKTRKPYTITKQRERWTEEEHNRFLEALKLHGRAWQRIEEHIGTKTAVQIRSHAQKFFSKLEKEALEKGVPMGETLDIDIPPPRPKRKPSNPYPRKNGIGTSTLHNSAKDGNSAASSHAKQALDLDKEPRPEKHNGDERPTTIKEHKDENCSKPFSTLQEALCSSLSSANKSSILLSVPLRNSSSLREFIPLVKEAITRDETNESFVTIELENQKLEIDNGKQINGTCKVSNLENFDASQAKFILSEKTDGLNCSLTVDGMRDHQNYPRHVAVHVVDGNSGTGTENPSQDMLCQDSIYQPIGGVNEQPNLFNNSAASNTSETLNNTARFSIHQSFLHYLPFTQHNQADYQSFLQMSSTFSSLIFSNLLQNPAAHAAASFAATFWPYSNPETSGDSSTSSQGVFPTRQIGSPPSVAAIAAATVASATAWWAAHGLLPFCAPPHAAFACSPSSVTTVPSKNTGEALTLKMEQGKSSPQNPPPQDKILDPEYTEALQAQHSASKLAADTTSDSEESGDAKLNTSSKTTDQEMNRAISEHPDCNKTMGRKQVARSSCGSNTTSGSEVETHALKKDEKGKEEPEKPDANHLAIESSNRPARNAANLTDSWKEVSEEGRLAFHALFSREVLPQSFSPPYDVIDKDNQMDNINGNKQNRDDKDEDLDRKKCSSNCEGVQKNLAFVENNVEEGLLNIGLGPGKLKSCRTGFKPYKRCSVEAKEIRIGTTSNQGEEKGSKRIRLEGEAFT